MFKRLIKIILKSLKSKKKSYCKKMLLGDIEKIRRKILEEAYELVRETIFKKIDKKRIIEEFCDLIFHSCLLIVKYKIDIKKISKEMKDREEPN
ncbi:phosphoribosyl-ATP diphosphatase [Candidatus Vidania fulgoroideorum]